MSETSAREGQCLCGQVQISANTVSNELGACHCDMCRRWSGGPYLGLDCGTDIQFSNEDAISVFNSSEWAERGFCKHCGTHLFYRLKASGQCIVPVGLFGDQKGVEFGHQIFVDEQPDYYRFANETKNMTGPEVFAMFAGES